MNVLLTNDARRFRLSLAASVLLNLGLLFLGGWLARPDDPSRPQARPHLRMVTLSVRPAPPASARRGIATAPQLSRASSVPQVTQTHLARAARPAVRATPLTPRRLPPAPHPNLTAAIAPALKLRVVTTDGASRMTVPHQVISDALAPPPEPLAPPPRPVPIVPAAPPVAPASPVAPSLPAVAAAPPAASRGVPTGSGAGWEGEAGTETNRNAGGPFGIGDGLAAEDVTRHIVYVLDISGSMTSRIARAEDELNQALRGLHPDETFNIVVFSGGSRLFDPDMADAAPGMIQKASGFLHELEVGGDTNLEAAVTRALMLRDVNEVVVLTDGVPTVGETDPDKLEQIIRQCNLRHARISTIGLVGRNPDGTDNSFAAAKLLQQIAQDSGGTSKMVTVGVASR